MNETYGLLRELTSPVTAITCRLGEKLNGMIANSAMRASLSATNPRVSVYVHKFNHSHNMIYESGQFVLHILDKDQMNLVYELGFESGSARDKLAGLDYELNHAGLPVLAGCFCHFSCKVVNAMDTGGSTLFLAAIDGHGTALGTEPMNSDHMRTAMPEETQRKYLASLEAAQATVTEMDRKMKGTVWRGLE